MYGWTSGSGVQKVTLEVSSASSLLAKENETWGLTACHRGVSVQACRRAGGQRAGKALLYEKGARWPLE